MTPWNPNEPIEMLFNQIKDAQILFLGTYLGYNLSHLIMYALNNITNTGVFWDELHDFYHQHNTHKMVGFTLKNFELLLGQNENITSILWEVQHLPTFQ